MEGCTGNFLGATNCDNPLCLVVADSLTWPDLAAIGHSAPVTRHSKVDQPCRFTGNALVVELSLRGSPKSLLESRPDEGAAEARYFVLSVCMVRRSSAMKSEEKKLFEGLEGV